MIHPIKLQRVLRGLTQLELSRQTGIPNNKICLVERGYKTLRTDEIQKICQVLQVAPEQLQGN